MNKIFTFSILLCATTLFAQIPAGYYNSATGTGYTLKTQLYNIIKGHTDKGYNGLYTTYLNSDRDHYFENDNSVLDMYSENPNGTDPYNFSPVDADQCGNYSHEGDCYNREHIVPQSTFNSAAPMHNDAHFITPTDGKVNGMRSNYPHGMVGNATYISANGSKLGSALNSGYSAGYSGTVFEPIDEFKGDIARMYFYFATRYENTVSGYNYPMFNGTSNQVFTSAFLEILKHWNAQDPVSQREIERNNAIYARQNNRNPYIDHPEYVQMVWGTMLSVSSFDIAANVLVFPNPSNDGRINIQTDAILNEIDLISVNGQVIQQIKNPFSQNSTYTLEHLSQGFYFIKMVSGNESVVRKIMVN